MPTPLPILSEATAAPGIAEVGDFRELDSLGGCLQHDHVAAARDRQYDDDRNLSARQRLWAVSRREPDFDLVGWTLDLARLDGHALADVLDLGCGNGLYERALVGRSHRGRLVALDLSLGMLRRVPGVARLQADAQTLPLDRDTFDVVLAPHVLYHVPDPERAAREIRRVLRRGGRLIASTNGAANLIELRALVEAAVGTGWRMVRPPDGRFDLESGATPLRAWFETVERIDCPVTHTVVTDLDALTAYVASVGDRYEPEVGMPWTEVVKRVRERAGAMIDTDGQIRLRNSVGAFLCR